MQPQVEVALSVLAYSACSGSLVLINKLILHNLPYPSLVVTFQLVATLIFIYGAKFSQLLKVDALVWEHVVPYLYYIVAFTLGVYCNMKSLTLSNVETVVVFRALTPVLVAFLDAIFLGREYPSTRSWTGLSLIVMGAYGYASLDEQFHSQGWHAYVWPTAYLFMIAFEMAYAKSLLKSVKLETLSGPVFYTNLLGLPPMLAFAAMGKKNEYERFYEEVLIEQTHPFTFGVWVLVIMGCVAGTAIGYAAWWCRDKVSATSFTLVGVINKCLTIMVNFCIWDQHAKPAGVACLLLCLVGGTLYQQAPMRSEAVTSSDKDALSESLSSSSSSKQATWSSATPDCEYEALEVGSQSSDDDIKNV